MDKLKIYLIGNPEVFFGNNSIYSKLSSKSIGILAILLCNKNKKVVRDKISNFLWPDCYETANYNLRYNLWNLKKNLPVDNCGNEFLITDNKYISINPDYLFESDVTAIEDININDDLNDINFLENIKAQFRGDFLEDFYIKDSDEFNDWVFSQRAIYQKMQLQTLNALTESYLKLSELEKAEGILEEVLKLNPYDEESHYKLMEIYIRKNETNLAIKHYKKVETLLIEDLNTFPQKKIKDLYLSLINNKEHNESIKSKEAISIRLNEYADDSIDYFLMSELAEKILNNIKKSKIQNIRKTYLEDIGTIQPRIFEFIINSSVIHLNEVRLFYSLKNVLQILAVDEFVQIIIYNKDKIDKKSQSFINFIEASTDISIKYV